MVREASKRVLGLRPFDVQLIGNISFLCGFVVNIHFMATHRLTFIQTPDAKSCEKLKAS